jgi:hypothetical protein
MTCVSTSVSMSPTQAPGPSDRGEHVSFRAPELVVPAVSVHAHQSSGRDASDPQVVVGVAPADHIGVASLVQEGRGRRTAQRWHATEPFAWDPERDAAGGQHPYSRGIGEDAAHQLGQPVHEVFAVVQEDQDLGGPQSIDERVLQARVAFVADSECDGDLGGHVGGVRDRGQCDRPQAGSCRCPAHPPS